MVFAHLTLQLLKRSRRQDALQREPSFFKYALERVEELVRLLKGKFAEADQREVWDLYAFSSAERYRRLSRMMENDGAGTITNQQNRMRGAPRPLITFVLQTGELPPICARVAYCSDDQRKKCLLIMLGAANATVCALFMRAYVIEKLAPPSLLRSPPSTLSHHVLSRRLRTVAILYCDLKAVSRTSEPQAAIARGAELTSPGRAFTMGAPSAGTPIHQLPEELVLQIASHLPDSADPRHLKNLCLVSRRFHPAAQEILHATAKLLISCGCHPKVNPLLKLLRTLFDRPDLASKVRFLRIRTVRKNVAKLCSEQGFCLQPLRARCLAKLEELGYPKSHPWHRTIQNSIESGLAGLLLIMLPNLTHLDFWVKDHNRGPPSGECISGLFGGMCVPDILVKGWNGLQHLTTSDTHVLKSGIQFDSLTSLDLKTITIGTILRLNGPGSLQGTGNLHDLALTVSVQFMDRLLTEKAEIQLSTQLLFTNCM
jgi:hypothetical protein